MKIDSGSNLSAPDLAFVVPVYRQPESLSELVRRVQVVADLLERSSEVILLDDGSPTDSWRALQKLAEDNPPTVRALRMPRNVGQHTAVLIGLREARGEWCVVLDQDLQDPPEAIAGLLRASDGVRRGFRGQIGCLSTFLANALRAHIPLSCRLPDQRSRRFRNVLYHPTIRGRAAARSAGDDDLRGRYDRAGGADMSQPAYPPFRAGDDQLYNPASHPVRVANVAMCRRKAAWFGARADTTPNRTSTPRIGDHHGEADFRSIASRSVDRHG